METKHDLILFQELDRLRLIEREIQQRSSKRWSRKDVSLGSESNTRKRGYRLPFSRTILYRYLGSIALSLSSSFHLIFPHFQSFFSFAARLELSITMPQGWLLFFTCSPGSCPYQSDERRASQRPVFAMRKIATGPSQEITAVDAGIPTGQDLDAASYGPRKKENRLGRFDCASRGRGRNGSSSN